MRTATVYRTGIQRAKEKTKRTNHGPQINTCEHSFRTNIFMLLSAHKLAHFDSCEHTWTESQNFPFLFDRTKRQKIEWKKKSWQFLSAWTQWTHQLCVYQSFCDVEVDCVVTVFAITSFDCEYIHIFLCVCVCRCALFLMNSRCGSRLCIILIKNSYRNTFIAS